MTTLRAMLAAAAATAAFAAVPAPADAATGQVVVFSSELVPAATYSDPSGCNVLPPLAHIVVNLTDAPITVYADPLCIFPALVIGPGFGAHVPTLAGSFAG